MIAFLSGNLESLQEDAAVIDVGGVGYEVNVSSEVLSGLSAIGVGNTVRLYTYTYIREDTLALYGFLSRDDLSLFKLLITVSGIGPKGGLSLLSTLSAEDLRFSILTGDARTIARAPGIGRKTAERVILDLRDKVSSASASKDDEGFGTLAAGDLRGQLSGSEAQAQPSPAADAVEALVALGYQRAEAARAVKKCGEKEDTEAILREALRFL
ncbi:MAG: Holliday junction branch migration protein RuvA [Eubacteriales bacterium]|nr:Holliday junction branch migration protein RuvA [Eubacteriales bacterium]